MAETPDDFDDIDTLPLMGVPIATPEKAETVAPSLSEAGDDDRPMLMFRDADVPGRDYQPRLLRFGEAA